VRGTWMALRCDAAMARWHVDAECAREWGVWQGGPRGPVALQHVRGRGGDDQAHVPARLPAAPGGAGAFVAGCVWRRVRGVRSRRLARSLGHLRAPSRLDALRLVHSSAVVVACRLVGARAAAMEEEFRLAAYGFRREAVEARRVRVRGRGGGWRRGHGCASMSCGAKFRTAAQQLPQRRQQRHRSTGLVSCCLVVGHVAV
jgi:hypothetical protein